MSTKNSTQTRIHSNRVADSRILGCNCHIYVPRWTKKLFSVAGTWTRVSRVRAEYPNQLDYNGSFNVHIFYSLYIYWELNSQPPMLRLRSNFTSVCLFRVSLVDVWWPTSFLMVILNLSIQNSVNFFSYFWYEFIDFFLSK